MAFHCTSCYEPVIGDPVTEGFCTRCLFGVESIECEICSGPIEIGNHDDVCDSCQEIIDVGSDDDDMPIDEDDEEFLRGPTF